MPKHNYKLVYQCGHRWVVSYTYNEYYPTKAAAEHAFRRMNAPTIEELITKPVDADDETNGGDPIDTG